MEIERKYLVSSVPDLRGVTYDEIIQGYVSVDPEFRVRKKGDKYFATEKSGIGIAREEKENEITEEEFSSLIKKAENRIIHKTRYYIPYGKYTCELDIYKGKLSGLVVCEVEFENLSDANCFVAPAWFSLEVTDNIKYKNKNLSLL